MGDYEQRPKPKAAKPVEQSRHKEASWVKPNTTGNPHVGSIFFRTKDHSIDAHDRELIGSLANAYARYAERDKGRHTGAPVSAQIVGYADPRSSEDPDNEQLSELRAATVATQLDGAFATSGIDKTLGFARTDHHGVGVASGAPTHADALEGNSLAPFRRADIFVHGKAESEITSVVPNVYTPPVRPEPPDYSGRKHPDSEIYMNYVERFDRQAIKDTAITFQNGFSDDTWANGFLSWGVPALKPIWWDSRAYVPAEVTGRGKPVPNATSRPTPSLSAHDRMVQEKARRMVADHRLYSLYALDHADHAVQRFHESGRRDEEASRVLGEIWFMFNAICDEAAEVQALVDQ